MFKDLQVTKHFLQGTRFEMSIPAESWAEHNKSLQPLLVFKK